MEGGETCAECNEEPEVRNEMLEVVTHTAYDLLITLSIQACICIPFCVASVN